MKPVSALKSGLTRSLAAWKSILIFWFISLIMAALIVSPVRSILKASLSKSAITDQIAQGINMDVFGDMGPALKSMIAVLSSGIMFMILLSVLINIFLTGGIFDAVKRQKAKPTLEEFFRACARNFRPFAVIMLLLYVISLAMLAITVVFPVSIAANSETAPEGIVVDILRVSGIVFLVLLAIINLAADYARAWQAERESSAGIKAFGFGFSKSFKTFLSSFPLMIFIFILQAATVYFIYRIMAGFAPLRAGGPILMFIVSQLTILLSIFIKVLRYASVTSLMELTQVVSVTSGIVPEPVAQSSDNQGITDTELTAG
jgi:hypothetical protein